MIFIWLYNFHKYRHGFNICCHVKKKFYEKNTHDSYVTQRYAEH